MTASCILHPRALTGVIFLIFIVQILILDQIRPGVRLNLGTLLHRLSLICIQTISTGATSFNRFFTFLSARRAFHSSRPQLSRVGIGRQSNPVFSVQCLFISGRLTIGQNSSISISSQNLRGVGGSLDFQQGRLKVMKEKQESLLHYQ